MNLFPKNKNEERQSVVENSSTPILNNETIELSHKAKTIASNLNNNLEEVISQSNDATNLVKRIMTNSVKQAEIMVQNSMIVHEFSDQIEKMYSEIHNISDKTNDTKSIVANGLEVIEKLKVSSQDNVNFSKKIVEDMSLLNKQIQEITSFTDTIKDLAGQTRLLSLNAAIEAAHAGEFGAGFSVVANEVKKLSEASALSAQQIAKTLYKFQGQVKLTVDNIVKSNQIAEYQNNIVQDNSEHFTKILDSFEEISVAVVNNRLISEDIEQKATVLLQRNEEANALCEDNATNATKSFDKMDGLKKVITDTSKSADDLRSVSEELHIKINRK